MATAHLALARALPLAMALVLALAPSAQAASVHSGLAATSRGAESGFGAMRLATQAFALVMIMGFLLAPSSMAAKGESNDPTPAWTGEDTARPKDMPDVDADPGVDWDRFEVLHSSTLTVAPLETGADLSAATPTTTAAVKVVRQRFNMSAIDPIVWYLPRSDVTDPSDQQVWKTSFYDEEGDRDINNLPNRTIVRGAVSRIGSATDRNNNATRPRMVFFSPGGTIAPYGALNNEGNLTLSTSDQHDDDQPPNADKFENPVSIYWGGTKDGVLAVKAVEVQNVTLQQQQVSLAPEWLNTSMRVHFVSLYYPVTVYNEYEKFEDLPVRTEATVRGEKANPFFNADSEWNVEHTLAGVDVHGDDDHLDFDHLVVPADNDLTFSVPPHTSFFQLNGSVGVDSGQYSVKLKPQPPVHQQRYDSGNMVIGPVTLYQTPLDPTVNYTVVVTPHDRVLRVQAAIFHVNEVGNSTTDGSGGQALGGSPSDTASGSGTDGGENGETAGKNKSIIGPVVGGVVGGVGALALVFALIYCMRRKNKNKTHQHEPLTSHTSHVTHTEPMVESRANRLAPGYAHNARGGSNATEKHMLMASEVDSSDRHGRDSPLGPPVFATYTSPDWTSHERSLHSSSRSSPTRPPPVSMPAPIPQSGQSSSNASFHSLSPSTSARTPYIPTPAPVSQPKSNRSSRSGRSGRSKRGKHARAAADKEAANTLPGFVPRSRSKRNSGLPVQMADSSDSEDTSDWDSDEYERRT